MYIDLEFGVSRVVVTYLLQLHFGGSYHNRLASKTESQECFPWVTQLEDSNLASRQERERKLFLGDIIID